MSKVLVAKVPIRLPSVDFNEIEMQSNSKVDDFTKSKTFETLRDDVIALKSGNVKREYDKYQLQQDMKSFAIEFLDFSERTNHSGTVCKDGLCCHYDIDISDNGSQNDNRVWLPFLFFNKKSTKMTLNVHFYHFVLFLFFSHHMHMAFPFSVVIVPIHLPHI